MGGQGLSKSSDEVQGPVIAAMLDHFARKTIVFAAG